MQLQSLFLSFLFFVLSSLAAQTVTTLVPNSTTHSFEAISWHSDGRIYSPDFINGRFYQINLDGTISTILENLSGPLGGAFDHDGNFYFSEYYTGFIYKLDSDGVKTQIGQGFGGPTGILVDSSQTKLFISDYNNDRVNILDLATGTRTVLASGGGIDGPDGIVYALNGDLIVANFDDNQLHRITMDGVVTDFASLSSSPNSGYLTGAPDGGYFSAGLDSHKIWYITPDGQATPWAGTGIGGNTSGSIDEARFFKLNGIAISPDGDTLIVSNGSTSGGLQLVTGVNTLSSTSELSIAEVKLELFPNPVQERLTIRYQLATSQAVTINLLAADGKLITNLSDTTLAAGEQQHNWAIPASLLNGTYTCQLTIGGKVVSRSFVLNRL